MKNTEGVYTYVVKYRHTQKNSQGFRMIPNSSVVRGELDQNGPYPAYHAALVILRCVRVLHIFREGHRLVTPLAIPRGKNTFRFTGDVGPFSTQQHPRNCVIACFFNYI